MNKKLSILIGLSFFVSLFSANAQLDSNLSRQQMLSDFDYLLDTLLPQIYSKDAVFKSVTGVDLKFQMEKLRKEVENMENQANFPYIIQQALNLTGDEHSRNIPGSYINDFITWSTEDEKKGLFSFVDTSRIKEANQRYLQCRNTYKEKYGNYQFYLYTSYLNGEYYNLVSIKTGNRLINSGDKIVKVFNVDVHRWVADNLKDYSSYNWDSENKRFYANNLIYSPVIASWKEDIQLTFETPGGGLYTVAFNKDERPKFIHDRWLQINLTKVKYC
jgi:hypothetical protein